MTLDVSITYSKSVVFGPLFYDASIINPFEVSNEVALNSMSCRFFYVNDNYREFIDETFEKNCWRKKIATGMLNGEKCTFYGLLWCKNRSFMV